MASDIHINRPTPRPSRPRLSQRQETVAGGPTRWLGIITSIAIVTLGAGASVASAPAAPQAQQARTLNVTDTAHLKLVHKHGEYINEEGHATGTLPGRVILSLEVAPVVVAHFTIQASGGSISGTGTGRPKGRSEEPSFGGTMSVSHGTGRYKHAHGRGGFYGTINLNPRSPKSYSMVVQTTGHLSY